MKKITLLALLTIVCIFGVSQMVLADSSTLSVLPASGNSTVGTPFNISVQLNPASNKVCVVMGTLSLNNLACQSITVASGIMAQTTPTCASPSFILGIPKCATTAQNILSVSIKGTQAGQGILSLTGVKVIGAGADVAFSSQGGVYNIVVVQTTTPKPTTPKPTPQVTQPTPQPTQQITTPTTQPTTPQNNLPATAGLASVVASVSRNVLWVLLVIVIIICIIYGIYRLKKGKKNKV